MKKIFIGLLVAAAAGTAFYLLNRKTKDTTVVAINKELLTGKWKTVLQEPVIDSAKTLYQYEFQKEGLVLRSDGDSTKADTAHYVWSKNSELVWKENAADTAGKNFTIVQLTADSLQLQTREPAEKIVLVKLK